MKQPEAPSLDEKLAAAQREASQAQMHVESLVGRIKAAVQAEDFALAKELNDQLPEARAAHGHAAATATALGMVIADLAQQQAAHDAQIQAEHRKVQARKHLETAHEAERSALDELQQCRAELAAGLEAIGLTIRRGYQLESAARQARTDAYRAQVDLGEISAVPGHVAAPNVVSSLVEASPSLLAILHGQALP